MKTLMIFLFCFVSSFALSDTFEADAQKLVMDLKQSLMKNLSQAIEQDGVVNAVQFCHVNAKKISKSAAGKRIELFKFGRTSHKARNDSNRPQLWAETYLKDFKGKLKTEVKNSLLIKHEGKRIYLEPLFVEGKCLLCHGENISGPVSDKIKSLYPQDQAVGFKLGEFRGFIWVMEN